jgi:hypothetical protein
MGGWGRLGLVVFGCVVGSALAESRAQACTCFDSSVVVAPATDVHPRGAPIAFGRDPAAATFCGGLLEVWTVTVDGESATLVGDAAWNGVQRVAIEPEPGEGAEVVLEKSCEYDPDAEGCLTPVDRVERARFVIGPADDEAPSPIDDLVVEHTHGEFEYDCGSLADLKVRAAVDLEGREPGGWIEISFRRDDAVVQIDSFAAADPMESSLYADADEYAGSEVCVDATAFDAAGNASAVASQCTSIAEDKGAGCRVGVSPHGVGLAVPMLLLLRRRRR